MATNEEALKRADEIISDLAKLGYDYANKRTLIADLLNNYLWNGNWGSCVDFDDGTPSLRLIQEDEYDQHMGNDEDKPEYATYSAGHYVIVEKSQANDLKITI